MEDCFCYFIGSYSISMVNVFFRNDNRICNLIDPAHSSTAFELKTPELLSCCRIYCTRNGWLLMCKSHESLFLFNPFTGYIGQYPPLFGLFYAMVGFGFTAVPTTSGCMTLAISNSVYGVTLSYIYQDEKEWHYVDTDFTPDSNPVFLDGAFYCMGFDGDLAVFHIEDGDGHWNILERLQKPCKSVKHIHLTECDGELLSVFVGTVGKWVKVFRLDRTTMAWVEVKSLGNHMLFVTGYSCASVVAKVSGMENKIYFPRYHGQEQSIIFYSLETERYHALGDPDVSMDDFCGTGERMNCCWIEPRWC